MTTSTDWKARAEAAEVRVKELGAALQEAAETLEWAARRLRDTGASRGDIAAVNLAANRAREAASLAERSPGRTVLQRRR